MKLSSRGFTLVELMIVMSIIGILAAVLFPSVMRYMVNARNSSRVMGLGQIASAIVAQAAITQGAAFPGADPTDPNCINSGAFLKELPKFPMDPTVGKLNAPCSIPQVFGYGTGTNSTGIKMYVLSAVLENVNQGQVMLLNPYQGSVASGTLDAIDQQKRGTGPGYILY